MSDDLRERVARVIEDFEDLIGHFHLHTGDYERRKMTTEQRHLFDASVKRSSARLEGEPVDPHPVLAEMAPELAHVPPDGYEAVFLRPDVVDAVRWHPLGHPWPEEAIRAVARACADAAERRPKPEPETERVLLPIKVEPDEDDGGFVVSCAVPGVHGQGETIGDAVADLIEAARTVGVIA